MKKMENNLRAAELRIGNYVLHKIYGISRIQIIGDASNQEYIGGRSLEGNYFSNSHLPIPLTAEWLEKFGFKKHSRDDIYYYKSKFLIYNRFGYYGIAELPTSKEFHFVHELQNIVYALFREELTIKESENGK